MAWPEKGKKQYFCVIFLTDNEPLNMIYSGNAIRDAATCQPTRKAKIHLQWKANFTIFKDKQLKLETNPRGRHILSVQLYTGNGFHALFSANN